MNLHRFLQTIILYVALQLISDPGDGLDGYHAAAWPHAICADQAYLADVGTDIDHGHARFDNSIQE